MIARRTAIGGILLVAARLATRLFDLATMLVLARILLPADFGLVAIAVTLVSILEAILELPVNQALLRLSHITASQYDTAFTLAVLRGLVLLSILSLAAWPFARFYHDDRLVWLVCVLGLSPAARSMVSPRLAEFQKTMSFWRDFCIELVGKVVGFVVGVVVAILTGSYWAIAAGTIVYPITMATVSYVFAPYRPRLSLVEWRIFAGFVGWMSAAQVVNAVNWQCERLLLGKLVADALLGLFATASDLAGIPMQALFGPILRPLLVAFAHWTDQREKLAASYQAAQAAILCLGLPLLVGESLLAEPLVLLLLGDKWRGVVPLLRWLALSIVPSLFAWPAIPLMMSFSQTNMVLRRNVLELFIKLPIVVVGAISFGFWGIIFARCVSEIVCGVFCMHVVRRLVGLSVWQQLKVSWRAVAATSVMAVPVLACLPSTSEGMGPFALAAWVAGMAATGALTYVAVLAALWVSSGRPAGVEAMVLEGVTNVARRLKCSARARQLRVRPEDS